MVGMPVYATVDDYATYVGVPTPEFPNRLLARASRVIDKALVGARYDTDTDDLPTDTEVRDVLRQATCAQAVPWVTKWLCEQQPSDGKKKSGSGDGAFMDHFRVHNALTPEAYDILLASRLIPTRIRMRG